MVSGMSLSVCEDTNLFETRPNVFRSSARHLDARSIARPGVLC